MAIKKIVIDTNVYTAILKNTINHRLIFDNFEKIILPTIVIGELRAGFILGTKAQQNEKDLQQIIDNNNVQVLSIELSTTNFYANIYKQLRKKGKPIPTNDIWIAAICIEQSATIATLDKHFTYVSGLKNYDFK